MNKNKYWTYRDGSYELHFIHFYDDDEIILTFVQGAEGTFWYLSDILRGGDNYINAISINDAKKQLEDKIREHIEDEITYYEEMLEKFDE